MARQIPEFLIIGAAKSGTTSLITDLRHHPEVCTPGVEVNYFSHFYDKGEDWYRSRFSQPQLVCGEKSTSYLYDRSCAGKIYQYNPAMKLIILLREPVKRAYSNWTMRRVQNRLLNQADHFNSRSQYRITNLGFRHLFHDYLACQNEPARFYEPLDVFERSMYMAQISRFLEWFPRNQLLILIAERFFHAPADTLDCVSDFLGIGPFPQQLSAWKRKMEYPAPLDPETACEMHAFFQPFNRQLIDFLGEEIPEWDNTNDLR